MTMHGQTGRTGPSSPHRRLIAMASVLALLIAITTTFSVLSGAQEAAAAPGPPLSCTSATTAYATLATGELEAVNTATGALTYVSTFGAANTNALGITAGGQYAYAAVGVYGTIGQVVEIYRLDVTTGVVTIFNGPAVVNAGGSSPIAKGGINLANGIYYFAIPESGDSTKQDIYAFDTNTNTAIGLVGSAVANIGASGDLAFDAKNNMYLVVSGGGGANPNVLVRIDDLPTTAGVRSLTETVLSTLSGAVPNGIAFGNDGFVYTSSASTLYKLNPDSGALVSTQTLASANVSDLASCATPGTVSLQKNIAGRFAPTDQFNLAITGGAIAGGNTGTTTGPATGLHTAPGEIAGPIVGIAATTYTLTETAVSGSLSNYVSTIACTNTNDGAPVAAAAAGTGTWMVTFPTPAAGQALADVVCTIDNAVVPVLATTKSIATVNGVAASAATVIRPGDVVVYAVAVHNVGGVPGTTTLTETVPADTTYTGVAQGWSTGCAAAGSTCTRAVTVVPGAMVTTQFTVTVGAIPSGTQTISNVVTTSTGSCPSCAVANPTPARLALVKAANPTIVTAAGQVVAYSFVVANVGGQPVTGLTISDAFTAPAGAGPPVTCPVTILAPGASTTCTAAAYSVTQADIDNGVIDNSATATGTDPAGAIVTSNRSDATVRVPAAPSLTLVKSVNPQTAVKVGDKVTYTFAITNTGNVAIADLFIDDNFIASAAPALAIVCPRTSLAPGAAMACTGTHTVTGVDADTGSIASTATVYGGDPNGNAIASNPSSVTVSIAPAPQLRLVKTARLIDANHDGKVNVGDLIGWVLVVTNSGNVTMNDVTVHDPSAGVVTCPTRRLAAGASMSCTVNPRAVTAAELTAGAVTNTALATGTPANCRAAAATACAVVDSNESHTATSLRVTTGTGAATGGTAPSGPVGPTAPPSIAGVGEPPLAATGAAVPRLLGLASLALLGGAGLTVGGRRRRRSSRHAGSR
jgi:uncharacterized repeat protein (TIGR01451 family)